MPLNLKLSVEQLAETFKKLGKFYAVNIGFISALPIL